MLGHAVTVYGQFTVGTYGYVLVVDLTKIYAKEIEFVQLEIAGLAEDPVSVATDLSTLMAYPNDVNCPDVAFSYESDLLYLFLKESYAPYASNTRFTLFGKRYAKPITSLTDNLDIRESELELFTNYVLRSASLYSNKRLDPEIERNIQILETKLKGV